MSAKPQLGLAGTIVTFALALGAVGTPPAAAYQPVAFRLCTAEGDLAVQKCNATGAPPSYQVPNNRRLVIEQVSGDCGGEPLAQASPEAADIMAQTGGTVVPHPVALVTWPSLADRTMPLTNTRIYADPGSLVTVGITGISPADGGRFCRLSFSGQLDKP